MAVFKRGETYYYEFELFGRRHKKSTRCKNRRDAEGVEAAARLEVINDRAGIELPRPPAPTLREFRPTFVEWVNSDFDNQRTPEYYRANFDALLRFPKWSELPIDKIDEGFIEAFKLWALANMKAHSGSPVIKDTVNRYVGTLRKALRYAHFKLKLIDKLPVFEMYERSEPREYVFSPEEYKQWLEACPEPLKFASVLARYSGICRGEMLALQKDSVSLLDLADDDGFFGEIEVRRGLKRKYRRRTLKVNREMRDVLKELIETSRCTHVFTSPEDPTRPLSRHCLAAQLTRIKAKGAFHKEAGLHALRHTFLTEMGELTDPYTLQRIAGHSDITTTMRYVHPQKQAIETAFRRLFGNGQGSRRTNDIVLSPTQVAALLAGEVVLLAIPAGANELRLKSTQKPTLHESPEPDMQQATNLQ